MATVDVERPASKTLEDSLALVTDERIEAFERDGAVWIPGLLSPVWMRLIEQGVKRNVNNPGPLAKTHFPGEAGEFYDDYCNFRCNTEYQVLLAESPIADVVAKLLRSEKLWLFCDQIFVKEGYSLRSRWHQDLPFWLADGPKMATMWIALEPLAEEETLEYVKGSVEFPAFDHRVPKAGEVLPETGAPAIPDIESARGEWPIVSHASRPGDVLIFHPATLHGGGAMREGGKRTSVSLRFFGDGTRYVERDLPPDPAFPGVSEALRPGDPLMHSWFPQVYPRPA